MQTFLSDSAIVFAIALGLPQTGGSVTSSPTANRKTLRQARLSSEGAPGERRRSRSRPRYLCFSLGPSDVQDRRTALGHP